MMECFMAHFIRDGMQVGHETDAQGWRTATMPIGSVRQTAAELLRFGAEVEVLEPEELRSKMIASIDRLNLLYQRPAPRRAR